MKDSAVFTTEIWEGAHTESLLSKQYSEGFTSNRYINVKSLQNK